MLSPEIKCLTLQYQQGKGLKVYKSTTVDTLTNYIRLIAISKSGVDVIDEDNYYSNMTVQRLSPNVASELSTHLQYVYQSLMGSNVDEKIKKKLQSFKSELLGEADIEEVFQGAKINRPIDEIESWIKISSSATSSESQQKIETQIFNIYQRVTPLWKDTKKMEINKFTDLLDQTLQCLDELYSKKLYNEQKLYGMLQSIYQSIITKLQSLIPQGQQIFSNSLQQKLLLFECQKMIKGELFRQIDSINQGGQAIM